MYLHAGNNKVIRKNSIIGIFDLDTSTISAVTRQFLRDAERENAIESVQDEVPKSFILTDEKIYMTQISSSALHGRVLE